MHLAERIKVFLAMRRVKREGKRILLKFKSRPHGVFGVWHLLKSHYEKWVQKSPEALRHPGFLGWHPLRMHNMAGCTEKDISVNIKIRYRIFTFYIKDRVIVFSLEDISKFSPQGIVIAPFVHKV